MSETGDVASSFQSTDAATFPPRRCAIAPCSCLRCLASPMFVVVHLLVGVSYGPFVLWTPHATAWSWICVGIFHLLLVLLLASYLMCVFTDPGTIPDDWHAKVASHPRLAAQHRLCPITHKYRPLRSHYCSVTRRVVLNMDHFCPWVVNTVGFYNRKFFLLFLLYAMLSCLWVVLNSQQLIVALYTSHNFPGGRQWSSTQRMIASMAMLLDALLAAMLFCFGGFHARMVLLNETSIEGFSPAFNVAPRANWEQAHPCSKSY